MFSAVNVPRELVDVLAASALRFASEDCTGVLGAATVNVALAAVPALPFSS